MIAHNLKPDFLLDTSPLTALCRFPLNGKPYIFEVVKYATIILPEGVITEARGGKGVIARVALPFLKQGIIQSRKAPNSPVILDISYGKDLGIGERDVIKIALATGLPLIIDDKDAFIVACRFGLHPLNFQDFIIRLSKQHGLPKQTAVEIVQSTARQYPQMFLAHSLEMLSQE